MEGVEGEAEGGRPIVVDQGIFLGNLLTTKCVCTKIVSIEIGISPERK
jgi:hypothetical protein